MKVIHFPCGAAANESERKALSHIRNCIESTLGDDEWILLTNLAFSMTHQLQSDEIDIVAIGPPGVRVIEVKHWSPEWVENNAVVVAQEAERVTGKARKIGTTLRKDVADLGKVTGVILLTREARGKSLAGRPVRGVDVWTLREWKEAVGLELGAAPVLRPQQVARLGRILEPRSGVAIDGSLRRFAGYVNLERRTTKDERFHRIYAGVHSSRQDRVILHLYDLSASDAANAETRARREFDALRRLQRYDWAPRILDSFQPAPGYPGEMHFFTVVDPVAPSIEKRMPDASWRVPARLAFARSAAHALQELHGTKVDDEPMIHRNLTRRTLLVRHDNAPTVIGFSHAKIPSDVSVASSGAPVGGWEPETAPEVRAGGLHVAGKAADVYALCSSLTGLFQERDDALSRRAAEVLAAGMAEEPGVRDSLEKLELELARLLGESPPPPPPPPARFWTEDQVVPFQSRHYRVVTRLGSGGVGTTFKVVEIDQSTGQDLGTYVAKVAHDPAAGRRIVGSYGLARSHLGRHAGLSAIFEVAPEWRENEFTALMTWVAGSPVRDFIGVLPLLAEDQGDSGPALARRWLRSVCEALGVLHRNGLVHGDVSPGNLIMSGDDLVLTDYDFTQKIGEPRFAPGTVPYCAPADGSGDCPAQPSDDIYALAASFFHLLFDREPFRYDGAIVKEHGLNWEGIDRGAYAALADFLDRATHPEPKRRFESGADTLEALGTEPADDGEAAATDNPPSVRVEDADNRREERVEHLRSLLQSYPGSRWGNRETRGLDSPFAERTYVDTPLEATLHRDLLARHIRLVVLCGNAGDGKTALLQHLARQFGIDDRASSARILEGRLDDGLVVRMNLDGSASRQGRSADELLDEFMAPFQKGAPDDDIAHLLAINDGRLLEWIERVEERCDNRKGTPLTRALSEQIYAAGELRGEDPDRNAGRHSHLRFISLNQRSLVGGLTPGGDGIGQDFLKRLLDQLYGGTEAASTWAPCRSCSAQERCEVFRANRVFGPDVLADADTPTVRARARARLFEALQAVHLRGETHVTVRELRAALVYILFGVHFCDDYHEGVRADRDDGAPPYWDPAFGPLPAAEIRSGSAPPVLPYWDRAFDPESPGRQGGVLRELVRFDPALEAHPRVDRRLLQESSERTGTYGAHHRGQVLASARRRAYFEWTEQQVDAVTGDRYALGLARGRHFRRFRDLPLDADSRAKVCERLCDGIARLEVLPSQALERPGVVPLRITPRTPTDTAFWVEKPLDRFRIEPDLPPAAEGLDRLHRQASLVYRYMDGREERLRLGAELFHLLWELADGYQLGDVSTDDTFAHLSIFVQRLVREDDRTILAWNPMEEDTIYEINAESGNPQRMVIRQVSRDTARG